MSEQDFKFKDSAICYNNNDKRQKELNAARKKIARDSTVIKASSPDLHQLASMRTDKLTPVRTGEHNEQGSWRTVLTYSYKDLKVKATIAKPRLNETSAKLLDMLLTKYRETSAGTIQLRISDLQKLLNIKDRTSAREQILTAAENISNIFIALTMTKTPRNRVFSKRYMHMFSSEYDKHGKISFYMDNLFKKSLDENSIPMVMVKTIYKYRGTAYYLFDTIIYNYQVNYAKHRERANKVSFNNLLNNIPYLPNYEKVATGNNRHIKDRIITLINKAIEDLKDEFKISIHLASGEEVKSVYNLPYTDFEQLKGCYLQVDKFYTLDTDKVKELNSKKIKK